MKQIVWQSAACVAALFLMFIGLPGVASAFEVSPMRVEMTPTGSGASTVITVRNTLAEPLAIEVYATDRVVKEDGDQDFKPNEDDFLLFPPQAFIQPGASQAFRVQYIGDPNPPTSRSYVINVSQVPVKKIDGAGVQLVYQFGAAIYVNPKGAVPALTISEAFAENGKVKVRITNEGNRVAFLNNDRVVVTTPSGDQSFEGDVLNDQVHNPIVPPGGGRLVTFDTPGVKPGAAVSAIIFPKDD